MMKIYAKRNLFTGFIFIIVFACFTWLVQVVDVKPLGVNSTCIGFSTLNCAVHELFGVNMTLYTITDWLGLVPILAAFSFAVFGAAQLVKRRSLFKVDADILILGAYYFVVAVLYMVFEFVKINYRPILINGFMETSYPSSTTLLVVCVMLTVIEQNSRRCKNAVMKTALNVVCVGFTVFMVLGRLLSGVHWLTDILGSVLVGIGLFYVYKGCVLSAKNEWREG